MLHVAVYVPVGSPLQLYTAVLPCQLLHVQVEPSTPFLMQSQYGGNRSCPPYVVGHFRTKGLFAPGVAGHTPPLHTIGVPSTALLHVVW
jgi:hypothetical protein